MPGHDDDGSTPIRFNQIADRLNDPNPPAGYSFPVATGGPSGRPHSDQDPS